MKVKKRFFVLIAFSVMAAMPVFSEEGKFTSISEVNGRIKVLENNTSVWFEFKAIKEANNIRISDGFFRCWPEDKSEETSADVVYMQVDDGYAWFAGKCTNDNGDLTGRWFFMVVHDGGTPGCIADQLWLDWLPATPDAETIAKAKVENLEKPAVSKSIEAGDIIIKVCSKEK